MKEPLDDNQKQIIIKRAKNIIQLLNSTQLSHPGLNHEIGAHHNRIDFCLFKIVEMKKNTDGDYNVLKYLTIKAEEFVEQLAYNGWVKREVIISWDE